jgi:glycosyltransferase involved in cell wall biosynthesis
MTRMMSVITPTYNRAHTLPRTFASLQNDDPTILEWIVVDDGSTDGTADLVAGWKQSAAFPITLVVQSNRGKAVAYGAGLARAQCELATVLDSDDWIEPRAITSLVELWRAIPGCERSLYSGITVLASDADGHVLGSPFPQDTMDSTFPAMLAAGALRGDKWGFHRTDVLRAFPFPAFPGERFVPEGVVWNRINRQYRMRFTNRVLLRKEYQPGGLMSAIDDIRLTSPRGANLYYREMLNDALPTGFRFRTAAAAARFGIAARMSLRDSVGGWRRDPVRWFGALAGWLLSIRGTVRPWRRG